MKTIQPTLMVGAPLAPEKRMPLAHIYGVLSQHIEVTPRVLLDLCDSYMADPETPEALKQALSDAFAAYRGPDRKKDKKLGHRVTAAIRGAMFPRTAVLLSKEHAKGRFRPRMTVNPDLRKAAAALRERGGHYASHAWRGLLALARWSL